MFIICGGLLSCYQNRMARLAATDSAVSYGEEAVAAEMATGPAQQRVRGLERLNLSSNNLSAAGMSTLASVLAYIPMDHNPATVGGLVSLDLSGNARIGDVGVERLCEGLMRCVSLRELYLRAIQMSFSGWLVGVCARALVSFANLFHLSTCTQRANRPPLFPCSGIFALSGVLSESRCLNLLDMRANAIDMASLMALVRTLSVNTTLTMLLSDAHALAHSKDPLVVVSVGLVVPRFPRGRPRVSSYFIYYYPLVRACFNRSRILEFPYRPTHQTTEYIFTA